jgi:hypothetical protein
MYQDITPPPGPKPKHCSVHGDHIHGHGSYNCCTTLERAPLVDQQCTALLCQQTLQHS